MTPLQNYLQVQLALVQHHLDDARIYSETGHQDATGLSLDDAEESVERVGKKSLPPPAQQQLEQVADDGDQEAEKAGVPATRHEEKGEKIACFQLGMDVLCRQIGITGARRELFRKVASKIAMGEISNPYQVLQTVGSLGSTQAAKPAKRTAAIMRVGKPGMPKPGDPRV